MRSLLNEVHESGHRYSKFSTWAASANEISGAITAGIGFFSKLSIARPSINIANHGLLVVQVRLITQISRPTSDQTGARSPRARDDQVVDILHAFRAEKIRFGVRGDVLLEDEVLRVVEGVDGPVFGVNYDGR